MNLASWLRRLAAGGPPPVALGDNLLDLRSPQIDDFPAWRELRESSRDFLAPWEPTWPADDLTRAGFQRRLRRFESERNQGTGYAWFLFIKSTGELAGGVNLTNVRLGASRSGAIGYWMGEKFAGKGLMRRAVGLVLTVAYGEIGLQRVEAVCIPGNTRSMRLLESLGFRREGLMREFLEINGTRRDHILYGKLKNDSAPAPANRQ